MKTLFLIRGVFHYESWDYYASNTGVWIYGDVNGYQYLRGNILKATQATQNIPLTLLDKNPTSMRGVILPAKPGGTRKPRLKFIERVVSNKRGPNMELVIYGNRAGYHYLADQIAHVIDKYVDNTDEHIHLDYFSDPHVVPPGVSINLRGPLRKWGPNNFGGSEQGVYAKNPFFLPSDVDELPRQGKSKKTKAKKLCRGFESGTIVFGQDKYREIAAAKSRLLSLWI